MRELSLNNCRLDRRYDVRRLLGRGSYAEVYLARDVLASPQSPHSQVVIKALNVFLQNDLDADLERTLVENFQNEAIALDRVRHPNIISRLGHGTARDLRGTVFHYLVLEYLAGGDLQRLCKERKVTIRQAMKYIEQICAGLRHAHAGGVIHRDIKPHNLLLTADLETVKIADFGVARFSQSDTPITRVGTNIYAPPEHSPMFAGQTGILTVAQLTPAADIYSLAKSIYGVVTCESPRYFSNQPITELPVSSRHEPWSAELLRVLNRATQTDPQARPQNIDEFWIDMTELRRIVDDSEVLTSIRPKYDASPQPHVARGYTPLAPMQPRFDTARNLHERFPAIAEAPQTAAIGHETMAAIQPDILDEVLITNPPNGDAEPPDTVLSVPIPQVSVKRKRRIFRKLAVFAVLIGLFASILYGTHIYLRNRGVVLPSGITNPFKTQTATANTDIYLRPSPTTNNDPIGLVTKNSKVRIVKAQNNWYEIDVVEQGRERDDQPSATHGWLYGKYLDID